MTMTELGRTEKVGPLKRGSFRTCFGKAWRYILGSLVLVSYFFFKEFTHHSPCASKVSQFEVEPLTRATLSAEENDHYEKLGLTPRDPLVIRDVRTGQERKIHGRFLHITDMHPDPFYKEGTSIETYCHANKPEDKSDYAPRFGKATAGCDSPVDLIDYTLDWIEKNLRDKIDFVIWTGDNIRHDNDRRNPRTEFQILDMNDVVSGKMQKLFANPDSENPRDFDVTIIPSIGNNDVFPHNMFALGPTLQTREYYRIWNNLIPQEQQRTFDRGACFVTEVIPGKLAVLSINTLYLYKANPLVDNCNSKKQPGYQLLVWLGAVLEELRQRDIKVWLSGHVPPIEKNYAEGCYDKFTLWTHEYRDIIIGGLYGHMNMDHFIPVDGEASRKAIDLLNDVQNSNANENDDDEGEDGILSHAMAASEAHMMGAKPVGKESYMNGVREKCYKQVREKLEELTMLEEGELVDSGKKPKKQKSFEEICESYSIVTISGSVIPTFNPSIRLWEYNTTGLETDGKLLQQNSWDEFYASLNRIMDQDLLNEANSNLDSSNADDELEANKKRKNRKDRKKKKKKKPDKTIPKRKPANLPLGPAYTPQLFSPTRFVQYYADLGEIDKEYKSLMKSGKKAEDAAASAFKYQVEYTSEDGPYPMKGLAVKDFISLASRLATDKKIWKKFTERAFMTTGYKDDDD